MATIIFEYTKSGRYAPQGELPPNEEGYNIWIKYPDDEVLVYLGFSTMFDFDHNVAYYQGIGDQIYATKRPL